jgi:hypothetical protein
MKYKRQKPIKKMREYYIQENETKGACSTADEKKNTRNLNK